MLPKVNSSMMKRDGKGSTSILTSREYQEEVLSSNIPADTKFKSSNFRDNIKISINCSEAMHVKEYERLC